MPPPPLLLAPVQDLAEMIATPVTSTYRSMSDYFFIFHPLMLLQFWQNMVERVRREETVAPSAGWEIVFLNEQDQPRQNCHLIDFDSIQCQTVCHAKLGPRIDDLVVFKWAFERDIFGLVESVERKSAASGRDVLKQKIPKGKDERNWATFDFTIRFIQTQKENVCSLDGQVFSVKKIVSANTLLRQMKVQELMLRSPLQTLILNPTAAAFQRKPCPRSVSDNLDESQMQAVNSAPPRKRSSGPTEERQRFASSKAHQVHFGFLMKFKLFFLCSLVKTRLWFFFWF